MSEAPGGKVRDLGIGASECAAALGIGQYQTPIDIYLRKIGEGVPVPYSMPMRMGHLLEPIVLDLYEEQAGAVDRVQKTVQAVDHPFMFATPDAIHLAGSYPVDAKTVGARSMHQWGEPGTDEVPQDYLVQVTHQMICTGARRADIAVLMAGQEFAVYPIEYDAELADMIVTGLRAFWQRVENRTPPEPVTLADVTSLYRASRADAVEATPEIVQAIAELAVVREQVKAFEKREGELSLEIKRYLADRDTLTHGGRTLATWRSAKPGQTLDVDALKRVRPDIYTAYLKPTTGSRRFLLKG